MKPTARLLRYEQTRCQRCRRPATCELMTGKPEGFWRNGFRGAFCDEHGRLELEIERDLQRGGLGGFNAARVGCTGKPSVGVLSGVARSNNGRTLWMCDHTTHRRAAQAWACARAERDRRGWKPAKGETA